MCHIDDRIFLVCVLAMVVYMQVTGPDAFHACMRPVWSVESPPSSSQKSDGRTLAA